jgi:hypothetical protein
MPSAATARSADVDQLGEIIDIFSSEWIVDDRNGSRTACGGSDIAPHLGARFLDHRHDFADASFHRSPSC